MKNKTSKTLPNATNLCLKSNLPTLEIFTKYFAEIILQKHYTMTSY